MNDNDLWLERISALADGQLDAPEFHEAYGALCAREELQASWQTYHLVGEVLRNGRHTPCRDGADFMAKFHARLAVEDGVHVPVASAQIHQIAQAARPVEAANEPVFRWKLVAGAASLAAVAAISWNWIGGPGTGYDAAQIAQIAPAAAVVARTGPPADQQLTASRVAISQGGASQVMLRDPRLDALLEAHHQAAGVSQMPSGFLRNATFEGPSR